jgi:hypothetical protein
MRKIMLTVLVLALVIVGIWFFVFKGKKNTGSGMPKPEPIAVSKHSEAFNQSMQDMMTAYYSMTEAFVNWDTTGVNEKGKALQVAIGNLRLAEMQKDSLLFPTVIDQWDGVKAEIAGLNADPDLAEKRASLNILSQEIFDLLRIVRYDVAKVYFQECPMALNHYEVAGNWLSNSKEVRNPYLGTNDPTYGSKMLDCGGPKDTLNYMAKEASPQ